MIRSATAPAATVTYRRTCPRRSRAARPSITSSSRSIASSPRRRHRPGYPVDLDPRVVYLPQRIRIPVLDVDVAPLLGDHVEQRATPQRVRLANHAEVAGRDVTHAALVDFKRAPRGLVLRERCGDLLAHGQLCELKSSLGRLRLRRCRSDVALIA